MAKGFRLMLPPHSPPQSMVISRMLLEIKPVVSAAIANPPANTHRRAHPQAEAVSKQIEISVKNTTSINENKKISAAVNQARYKQAETIRTITPAATIVLEPLVLHCFDDVAFSFILTYFRRAAQRFALLAGGRDKIMLFYRKQPQAR